MARLEKTDPVCLTVHISYNSVCHFLGYPKDREPRPSQKTRIEQIILSARTLVRPRGLYRELGPDRARDLELELNGGATLVAGLVTIGHRLERQVTQCLQRGEDFEALVLDAAGSAAVEEAADRLGTLIVQGEQDDKASCQLCRLSPGYGRFALEAQKVLLGLLPHHTLGVRLTPACLMVPKKSISFVLLLGERGGKATAEWAGCRYCGMKRCRYRREVEKIEMENGK